MTAFAVKLEELLGGQVGQAKDLQRQTVQALEAAILSFQSMAKQVGAAGETATSTIAEQLTRTLDQMAASQSQLNETMRSLVDQMRGESAQAQQETTANVGRLLGELSSQVQNVVGKLQAESKMTSAAHQALASDMAGHAKQSVDELAASVTAQTTAIEQAALAMRNAVADLGSSVDRNVTLMGKGADGMRLAAEQFTGSGHAIADVFDKSQTVSRELDHAAKTLRASSADVQSVVSDYRVERASLADLVDGLRITIDTAKRDASMTSDLVGRLESAAQNFAAAQVQADDYLGQLNKVLSEAHGSFSAQMLATVQKTNTEFHKHLANSTSLLASTIADLDGTIIEFAPRTATRGKVS